MVVTDVAHLQAVKDSDLPLALLGPADRLAELDLNPVSINLKALLPITSGDAGWTITRRVATSLPEGVGP